MHYSVLSRIRDVALFCALCFLVKIAFERTVLFIGLHKESVIHELNRSFMDQIYTAQRQLHFLEEHPVYSHTFGHRIAEIKDQLTTIEERYKRNSPSLVLLGPIGSAAIVAKEEQLQGKLLTVINDLSRIFAHINNEIDAFTQLQTIDTALESNKQILRTLVV